VFALWHLPWTLPCLVTHEHVCERIMGGADLFWPGVLIPASGFTPLHAGSKVAIRVHGNPAPFAVGIATQASESAAAAGFTGEAVKVLHVYRDCLWELGGRIVPNDGFQQRRVVAICDEEITLCDSEGSLAAEAADAPPTEAHDEIETMESIVSEATDAEGVVEGVAEAATSDGNTVEASDDITGQPMEAALSPDEVLMTAFLEALKVHVKPSDMPMLANIFIANFVLPNRPAGTTINVKSTQWRSFSAFLKVVA
jgi:translation initiation factor 2D